MPEMPQDTAGTRSDDGHLRTSCGRDVTVGRLDLGDTRHPARRIFLDLGGCPGCDGTSWAGLTVAEARLLASELLAEAAGAEQKSRAGNETAGRVAVHHVAGDAYAITVRGHSVLVDQPMGDGGQDTAPTPTELLVVSLASCVAFYAGCRKAGAVRNRHGPYPPVPCTNARVLRRDRLGGLFREYAQVA